MAYTATVAYIFVLFVVAQFVKARVTKRQQLPLPPGPKGFPIVGNVTDLPPKGVPEWQHWFKHKDLYGPISSVTAFGQTIIILHDLDMTVELLEKRSVNFSSRPHMVFASDMVGYSQLVAFQSYTESFREQRKLMAKQIGSRTAVARFQSAIDLKVRRLLLGILEEPEALHSHLKTESASVVLDILFGYTPAPHNADPLVDLANQVMEEFGEATVAGAWAVDLLPWLRHLPDWLPGTGFKGIARKWATNFRLLADAPLDFVQQQRARGSTRPSYLDSLLDAEPDSRGLELAKHSSTALYAGGADTTVAALNFFFLAMSLYPEVLAKAQEEIDRVLGDGGAKRLPSFEDRDKLPYVEAVVKEAMRWQPIAPLSLPHTTDQDDEFHGYRIPKGSIILQSIKWFSMDPAAYREPARFRPERFLGSKPERDPHDYAFGFGRRICPGRYLADSNMFLAIARSLAVFDIRRAVDEDTGLEVDPVLGTSPGIVAHPNPFQCRITPRSEEHAELIRKVEIEHPWVEGDDKFLKGFDDKT
ncbi:cytochrome P450 [Xylariales sp. PMI_506]|nr:cytochrome P450 [Xylariales sp. PMI_506]